MYRIEAGKNKTKYINTQHTISQQLWFWCISHFYIAKPPSCLFQDTFPGSMNPTNPHEVVRFFCFFCFWNRKCENEARRFFLLPIKWISFGTKTFFSEFLSSARLNFLWCKTFTIYLLKLGRNNRRKMIKSIGNTVM